MGATDMQADDHSPCGVPQAGLSMSAFSVVLHDYCGEVARDTIANYASVECQTTTFTVDAATQSDDWVIPRVHSQDIQTEMCNEFTAMRFEHIGHNDELVKLYTGVKDAATLNVMFDEMPPCDDMFEKGRKCTLSAKDQLLMTLMRLKLGLILEDLAFRFSVSKTSCSRIIKKWIDHLYVQLSFLIHWPTRGQINATMPADFRGLFPKTRVIIDCTEFFTQTPASLSDRSLMYSSYKGQMTWKALVGITPNGVVSFVSDLWAGSISDKQIVQESKLLDLCEKGDAIMGDKGFLISDLTTPRGIQLIIPPKKNKLKQMSKTDIELTRRVANVRIHVERHMERVKNFRVLSNLIGTMKANASKIWKVCNYLTALLPPLHPHDRPDDD